MVFVLLSFSGFSLSNGLSESLSVSAKIIKKQPSQSLIMYSENRSFILVYDKASGIFKDVEFTLKVESDSAVTVFEEYIQASCDNEAVESVLDISLKSLKILNGHYNYSYNVIFKVPKKILQNDSVIRCNGLFFISGQTNV